MSTHIKYDFISSAADHAGLMRSSDTLRRSTTPESRAIALMNRNAYASFGAILY
jgi:hypothetical protein